MQQESSSHLSSPPSADSDAAFLSFPSSKLASPTKASKQHKVTPANSPGADAMATTGDCVLRGGRVQSAPPSKLPASGFKKKAPNDESRRGSAAAAGGGAPLRCGLSAAPQPQPPSQSLALVPATRKRCQIFVDVSNIWDGLNGDLRALRAMLQRVQTEDSYLKLEGRFAFGSKTPEFASSQCDWEAAFVNEGFMVRSELRPRGGKESMVDDCIAAHVYRAIIDRRVDCIVLLSGDGNQHNPSMVSIMDAVLSALESHIRVVVWCWRRCANQHYRALGKRFPDSLFSLKFLDDCVRVASPPAAPPQPLEQCLQVTFDQLVAEADEAEIVAALRLAFGPDLKNCVLSPQSKKGWLFFRTHKQLMDAASLVVSELVLNQGCSLRIKSTGIVHKSRALVAAEPDSKKLQQGADAGPANAPPPSKPAPRAAQAAAQQQSCTITLRSASDVIIEACPAKQVLADVREDLSDVKDAVAGLVSTGESMGKTKKDFVFVNFSSRQSAEAALKHYQMTKELNLRGSRYAVTAAWDRRSQIGGETAIVSSSVVCNDDINDLLGLADSNAQPVSHDVSLWIDTLFDLADAQRVETSKERRTEGAGSFLQMLWEGASVSSEGDAAASARHSVVSFSCDSDSDTPVDICTQNADFMQFFDETAPGPAPLAAAEATAAAPCDPEALWTLPAVEQAAECMPVAEVTLSLPLPPAHHVGSSDLLCGALALDEAGEFKATLSCSTDVFTIQSNVGA